MKNDIITTRMKNKQRTFAHVSDEFKDYWKESNRKVHGGDHARGLRKTKRPFHSKKPMHLVLRSSRAVGHFSMGSIGNKKWVKATIEKYAALCEVTIYKYSNNGNHLHLAIRAKDHELFKKFLRTITGLIARYVMKAKKGTPAKGKFWDGLAFTRIAEWGKAYKTLKGYVIQNLLEAAGVIPYQPRQKKPAVLSTA